MKRKFKTLGLLVVAVMATSAALASAAQAAPEFTAAEFPASLVAAGNSDQFTSFGQTVKCVETKFTGTLAAKSPEIEITPEYNNCTAASILGTLEVTVTHNGCKYRFYNATEESADNYKLTTDIVCPAGKKIEVHVYVSKTAHTNGESICTLTVPPQTGLEGATGHDNTTATPKDVDVSGTVTGITVEQDRNSFACPAGTKETAGKYDIAGGTGVVTVQAKNAGGTLIGADIG